MKRTVLMMAMVGCSLGLASPSLGMDLVASGDGTVYDRSTGLLWQQGENARMSWQGAAERCSGLNLGGRSDWRLPSREELLSIVDRSRKDPSVDVRFFPKTRTTAYWTGSREKDRVWGIGFSEGDEFIFGGTELALYARCVADTGGRPPAVTAALKPAPSTPAPSAAPTSTPPAAEAPKAALSPSVQPAPASESPVRSAPEPVIGDPAQMLRDWAAAWSRQDVSGYLSHYGKSFVPAGNLSRQEWETQRRRALTRPEWIKVAFEDMAVTRQGNDRAKIDFVQTYRSNSYQDRVRKSVVMGREDGRWIILSEETTAVLP